MILKSVNPSKVVTSCEQILIGILGKPVNILPESENPQEPRYTLNLKGFTYFGATDRGRTVKVVPFIIDNYWLHFSIQFKVEQRSGKKYDYFLDGVSIAVFYGEATDETKLLLFRAEWDNKEENETSINHPQPHWHIHNTGSAVNAEYVSDFNIFLGIKEEENLGFMAELNPKVEFQPKKSDLAGFHFVMSAGWMFGYPYKHELTEINLKSWLKESILHIQEQLEYCQ